jgi:hypothetical protein
MDSRCSEFGSLTFTGTVAGLREGFTERYRSVKDVSYRNLPSPLPGGCLYTRKSLARLPPIPPRRTGYGIR